MERKKRDFFIATINREKIQEIVVEKETPTVETTVADEFKRDYFVTPSGKHPKKIVVPNAEGGTHPRQFDYLKGKQSIDVSPYAYGTAKEKAINKDEGEPLAQTQYYTEGTNENYLENNHNDDFDDLPNFTEINDDFREINYDEEEEIVNQMPNQKKEYQPFVKAIEKEADPIVDSPATKSPAMPGFVSTKKVKRHKQYKFPSLSYLPMSENNKYEDDIWAKQQAGIINQTFKEFNVRAEVVDKIVGPTVTQFLIKLAPGVNVNSIFRFENNIQLSLGGSEDSSIRLITRVPNTTYAGIEVPNLTRQNVMIGDMINCKEFKEYQGRLPIAVGLDVSGKKVYVDITEMPHCLIAGTTQSGKSVSLNTIILSLIYRCDPDYLRFVLIDPKQVELNAYEGIPHLAMPVVTNFDDFKGTLTWLVNEMERRYEVLSLYKQRNLAGLNRYLKERNEKIVPYLVVIMDEFSDWIIDAGIEATKKIQRIVQKARAAGIHIVLAAQRPSNDVIKGSIKANFDTRFAFKTASFDDSKVILGGSGAEKLVGRGDLLLKYMGKEARRIQAAFVSDDSGDISRIVDYLRDEYGTDYIVELDDIRRLEGGSDAQGDSPYYDERLPEVARFVVANQVGSNQAALTHFKMGFPRTNKIFLEMERLGIVSPAVKGKPREVLVGPDTLERILEEEGLV